MKYLPTKNCFSVICSTVKKCIGKEKPNINAFKGSSDVDVTKAANNVISLLVLNYYPLDYDDILLATRNYIKLENIEQYNIVLDEKLNETCIECGFNPHYPQKLPVSQKCLANACGTKNSALVNSLIKTGYQYDVDCLVKACQIGSATLINKIITSGVKPTIECLRELCKCKNVNLQIFTIIVNTGVIPDIECLKSICAHNKKNFDIINIIINHVTPDNECLKIYANSHDADVMSIMFLKMITPIQAPV